MPDENPYRSPEQPAALQAVAGKRSPPSKVVLVVAIVNLLLGALGLLCSGVSIYGLVISLTADASWLEVGPVEAESSNAAFWVITIVFITICCLLTAGYLLAGISVLYRKNWGRLLTLFMAGSTCLLGMVLMLLGPPQMLLGIVLQLYPLLVFSTLTQEKYAAEFIKISPEMDEGTA